MGRVNAQLTIQANDVLPTRLNLNLGSAIEADSGVLMKAKVVKTAVHADALTVYKADDKVTNAYLFVRNVNAERENYIYLYNDTDSDAAVAKLAGGEFVFLPMHVDKTFKVYGTLVDQVVEYGVFGVDSSAVTLA